MHANILPVCACTRRARIVLKEYEPTFTERRTTDVYTHIHIYIHIYEKSAIRLTSVGLAQLNSWEVWSFLFLLGECRTLWASVSKQYTGYPRLFSEVSDHSTHLWRGM